ncbi:MAG: glutamine-hydrolyzing GMP synthase [Fimbriimonas ginsengisoli]|uniref:GMP synthase [glutamine-hydrolyzing] n=1 Tax=Fimbriimonas ginsengisoli TaxID=1005039 RepID=A0A931PW94_FIMGI|nr:glutamine-hydrolyzing GMP synthase [Fimbriimonas ginsengisoli]
MGLTQLLTPPAVPKKHQTVLVVDFGGQYSQLIVRRVREFNIYSEMVPWQKAAERILADRPDAVILSGGPRSVLEPGAPDLDLSLIAGIPALGICYGHQLMAKNLGGVVETSSDKEYGSRHLTGIEAGSLASTIGVPEVWMSHGDQVRKTPPGFILTASTDTCPVAAFENAAARQYGVQFHPEVSHTPDGRKLLERFLLKHAGLKQDWSSESFIEETVASVQGQVGEGRVLCAVSGGVDSSVMAALLIRALGERAVCVFVDHGLLRKGEAEEVRETFGGHFKANLKAFDEQAAFFAALKGVTHPERKRKIVGEEFVKVFERHASELSDCDFLAQGTLYPDVIESGSSTAAKIKTHHNVGGLPDWMRMKLIEPLRWLFKDEVRAVGRALGLPEEMVEREPFPGPGLAVRITGEVTPERVRIVQDADWIFRTVLREHGLHRQIWQSYAALLDVRSVGVMGDERTYEHPIVLRAVASEDAMTARAVAIPFEVLEHVALRIVNEVRGVNRVFYDLTSKPPATIELE